MTVAVSPLTALRNCTRQTGPAALPPSPPAFALCALRATAVARVRTRHRQEYDGRACIRLRCNGCRKRAVWRKPRITRNRADARPLALRVHGRDRRHHLPHRLREAEIDAGERHHRERDRYPEPEQMVEVGRCLRRAAPAQSRQERAVARPPQPNAGQRQDQHADARPTDDGAAGIFGNRQVLMEAMQPADERRTKIDHVERPRGRWIEIDVDEPGWAALDRAAPRAPSRSPASPRPLETGPQPAGRCPQVLRWRSPGKPRVATSCVPVTA